MKHLPLLDLLSAESEPLRDIANRALRLPGLGRVSGLMDAGLASGGTRAPRLESWRLDGVCVSTLLVLLGLEASGAGARCPSGIASCKIHQNET